MSEISRTSFRSSNLPLASRKCSSSKDRSKWSTMACLPRPMMMRMSVKPARTASSTTYWIAGLSRSGSISLGWALVAGRNRVPSPAAGTTAFRTFVIAPPLRGAGVYPRGATRRPGRRARHPRIHFIHADVRVRVHGLRSAHRGLPALLRGSAHDLRGVRGEAEEGLPPSRHRVQGLGVLCDRQPREGLVGGLLDEGLGRRVVVRCDLVLGLWGRLHLQGGRRWLVLE